MTKFLIVGFDGLKREAAADGRMPNLAAFIREWSWCASHRAVFPVETYVNHPSIFSGYNPNHHGIIANMYHNRPGTSPAPYFLGSSVESIEANDIGGVLFEVPALGRVLGEKGLTMRVIGSNSAGSTRLKHHQADRYPGHLNLPVRDIGKTLPASEIDGWRKLHGDGYPLEFPDLKGSQAVVDSFFEVEIPKGLADVTVLWIGEPDHSSHEDGPNGPKTTAALAQADSLFGRVLDWWRRRAGQIQLAVVSDHGHVVIERHSAIRQALIDSGLRVATSWDLGRGTPLEETDLVMSGIYCAGLWASREGDAASLSRAVKVLQENGDLGLLLTSHRDLDTGKDSGLLPEALFLSDHRRSPDLRLVTLGDPATGLCACEPGLDVGAGAHGGLLPAELDCLLAWGGELFKRGWENKLPSGPADVAATILRLMGFDQKALSGLDGRVLSECLRGGPQEDGARPKAETYASQRGAYRQILQRTVYKDRIYLDRGFREL